MKERGLIQASNAWPSILSDSKLRVFFQNVSTKTTPGLRKGRYVFYKNKNDFSRTKTKKEKNDGIIGC
jgi:hypothetical protein